MTTQYPVLDITPETTSQQVFDAVANHLITQGHGAVKQHENEKNLYTCLYRTDHGQACAVGCLMTDDEATICDANSQVLSPEFIVEYKLERFAPHYDLLVRLQEFHDSISLACEGAPFDIPSLKVALADIADCFSLKYDVGDIT